MDDELGSGARSVRVCHDDDVAELLLIGILHAPEEGVEGRLAQLAPSLIDVMRHVLGEASQHGAVIAGIERGIIALDEGDRLLGCRHVNLRWESLPRALSPVEEKARQEEASCSSAPSRRSRPTNIASA